MGQFKPMVKMMTTEPTVELKLKKGGSVSKPKKMMDGGVMGALSAAPAPVGVRGGMAPAARPGMPAMAARRRAMMGRPMMAEGGETKATHKAEMKKMAGLEKELKSHESKPASKAHKGLKTGGVAMGQGGYAKGGIINTEGQGGAYRNTKMHTAEGEDRTPKKTGEVVMGKPGGFKKGGGTKYAKGGGVEGNVSTTPPGKTNTTTGEVRLGNAGGFKKGGSSKKAYATGGSVNDSGRPVAYPKKPVSAPVKNNLQSGTFKKGGKVKMAEGGSPEKLVDLSKGAYDKSIGPSEAEMDMARTIRNMPKSVLDEIKRAAQSSYRFISGQPESGSVTRTEKSVTVTPAKRRGGSVKC